MSRFFCSVLYGAAIALVVCPSALSAQGDGEGEAALSSRIEQRMERLRAQREQRSHETGAGALPARSPRALSAPTLGGRPSPHVVAMAGDVSLSLDGALDLGGYVFQGGVPFIHNEGGAMFKNTAIGLGALTSLTLADPYIYSGAANTAVGLEVLHSTTSGFGNTGVGHGVLKDNEGGNYNTVSGVQAMYRNTSGSSNTASGFGALFYNTTGDRNLAMGEDALYGNEAGSDNTALGHRALRANTGTYNTAVGSEALMAGTNEVGNTGVGFRALQSNTGDANTAVGLAAGINWTTGLDNIALGTGAYGVAGETGTIRIGGAGYQARTFVEGIRGATTYNNDAVAVLIDSAGQLGTMSSSARVKQDIEDMAGRSDKLLDLRPVAFRYKKPFKDGVKPIQFGLVAEEVAEVFPELVVYSDAGEPDTVKYHLLSTLLLNELQEEKQRRQTEVEDLRQQMAELRRVVADLKRRDEIQGQ